MRLEVIGDISNGLHNLNDILTLSFVKQNIVYFIDRQGQINTEAFYKNREMQETVSIVYIYMYKVLDTSSSYY